jgi:paraquat-inducible protein A
MSGGWVKAAERGLAVCHTCEKVSRVEEMKCPRCGSRLVLRRRDSIRWTISLMVSAMVLYIPSHVLPVLTTMELGMVEHNTIIGGMMIFWKSGAYPIAIVIFTASILIPLLKIVALTWLCAAAVGRLHPSPVALSRVYWFTEWMGRWSMVDVFVVGILVAVGQLGNYMSVSPGPGALAFAGVVVLTMFAAMSFDPRLLWDRLDVMEKDS